MVIGDYAMKKNIKILLCFMLMCFTMMISAECYAKNAKGVNVEYHTKQEIRDYIKKNNVDMNAETKYTEAPSVQKPYNTGTLSSKSLKNALADVNAIRYVAGIDADVKLNDSYNKAAQAAALINAANGSLSHYPEKPSGMKDNLYSLGYQGAGKSNLAWTGWYTELGYSVVNLWMDDGDASNISKVGHRRWILNPSMKETGFGFVQGNFGTFSSMYVIDKNWYAETEYYGVAWPAQNMPLEWFRASYPWSISMGTSVDASKIKVTLTRKSDNRKWEFSTKQADGYFNVDNGNYGKTGCIIFRPENISYFAGDSFSVKITGLEKPVSYDVNFFYIYAEETECNHSYKNEVIKKATFSSDGKMKKVCEKCGEEKISVINRISSVSLSKKITTYNGKTRKPSVIVRDSRGKTLSADNYSISYSKTPKKAGKYVVKVKLKGNYSGSKELTYTIKPKTVEIKNIKAKNGAFQITTTKGSDITGYQICYSRTSDFSSEKTYDAKGTEKVKNTIKNLKSGKTYYVKVRTYKKVTVNGKAEKVYSSYSEVKTIRVK